ncbi:MAG: transposase, partial [Dehalococcoidia bacterium]|nr:transposase [Dehalococcoidia bacterium]
APTPSTTTPKSPSRTIGSIARGFKIGVTKWFRVNTDVYSVWQRGYYEHVVRNETELMAIREYIAANPARWAEDENNPALLE